jgi:hypothetical protein
VAEAGTQRFPLEELRDDVVRGAFVTSVVDGDDVGVRERRDCTCFSLKPNQPFRVVDEVIGENLDRHIAPEPWIVRSVHLAHTPGSN